MLVGTYLFAHLEYGQTNRDNEWEEAQTQSVQGLDFQNTNGHGDNGDGLQQDQDNDGHGHFAQTMFLAYAEQQRTRMERKSMVEVNRLEFNSCRNTNSMQHTLLENASFLTLAFDDTVTREFDFQT